MNLNEYVKLAKQTNLITLDSHPQTAIQHQMIGLIGEIGELFEKLKKYERDISPLENFMNIPVYSKYLRYEEYEKDMQEYQKRYESLVKEFGDVFWYLCILGDMLDLDLDFVLQKNIEKLQERLKKNTIQGSGDDR